MPILVDEHFDLPVELKRAVKLCASAVTLKIVLSSRADAIYTVAGEFVPCVWAVEGGYVAGFASDKLECTILMDWSTASLRNAKEFAQMLAAGAAKIAVG